MSGTIAQERILRELAEMWTALSNDSSGEGGALRACSLTLVTLAEASEDFSALGEVIAALMPEHPARTIVVRLAGAGGRTLSERVYSQCWRPFGQKRQVCCEQVEIEAADAALGDLPSVILPLAVADLPLIVWCRSARLIAMPEFGAIAAMAHRVIVDGEAFCHLKMQSGASESDAARDAIRHVAALAGKETSVADFAWTRLTRWRAMLAQVFENKQHLAQLPRVNKVRVMVRGGDHVSAYYLAAWVMDSLTDTGVRPECSIEPADGGAAHGKLHGIELSAPDWSADLSRYGERLIVTAGGLAQCNPLPHATDFSLMEEELRITGRDPVFERTLAAALRLCGAEA